MAARRRAVAAVLGLLAVASASGAPGLAWRVANDRVALLQGDAVVWQFNHPPAPAKPFFHPVALPGHAPLTWLSPPDHPWHLGLWFSWKFIDGRNAWETDGTGRSEVLTRLVRVETATRPDFSARIEIELAYQPDENAAALLRESRTVEISAPAADGSYAMDWTMTFAAGDEPVRLDRTPLPGEPGGAPWGGYAGLTWRFAQEFTDWQVVNTDGARDLACHGAAATACEFSGRLDGTPMGVAILDHPDDPRSPTPWYVTLERATPFACVMPAPLFREPLELPARQSFTLRYRVIVHPGRWDVAQLREAVEAFAAER